MGDAWILNAVRTPMGKRKGALAHIRPDDLAGQCLNGLVEGPGVDPGQIEDVVMGCVTQVGEQGLNIGRTAVLSAGWPVTVPGTSVNRMCASSLQATNFAAQAVMAGMMDLTVGAGVESMTRVQMGGSWTNWRCRATTARSRRWTRGGSSGRSCRSRPRIRTGIR